MALLEIQVIPRSGEAPPGEPYYFVDRAIAKIRESGLPFEVEPLGTTIEGDLDAVLGVAVAAHKAVLNAGAEGVITVIKIADGRDDSPTMQDLVGKHRTELEEKE